LAFLDPDLDQRYMFTALIQDDNILKSIFITTKHTHTHTHTHTIDEDKTTVESHPQVYRAYLYMQL